MVSLNDDIPTTDLYTTPTDKHSTTYDPHPTLPTPNVLFCSVWHFVYDAYVFQKIPLVYVQMNLCNTSINVARISLS